MNELYSQVKMIVFSDFFQLHVLNYTLNTPTGSSRDPREQPLYYDDEIVA